MGAAMLSAPELVLDKDEAKMLAEGIAGVQEFYSFTASAEAVVWANLIAACAAVYGPRAIVIYNRKKEAPKKVDSKPRADSNAPLNSALDMIMNPDKYRT
jgi:hypothetical protein